VGGAGILETFPLPVNEAEQAQLRASARVIRGALDELESAA
jgi:L-lactate dehydrogenase